MQTKIMEKSTVTISKAEISDIPKIQQVANISFPDRFTEILGKEQVTYMMNMMYSTEALTDDMNSRIKIYYILYEEAKPIGYLCLIKKPDNLYSIDKIYLLTSYQGKGLGKFLFLTATEKIREHAGGPCRMELRVNRKNKSRFFYEKMGMKILKESKRDIGGGYYMDDYIMGIDLK